MSLKLGNTNIAGTQVLYSTTGNNTDGAMTQAATTTQLNNKADNSVVNLKANDADVVHKTGNESIAGIKTFNDAVFTNRGFNKTFNITRGTAPSSVNQGEIAMGKDINGLSLGNFYYYHGTNNDNNVGIYCYDPTKSEGYTNVSIQVGYNKDGGVFTTAPACDNGMSIVTTVNKSKSSNGYFKLGNGMIVQWGRSSQRTFSYPIAFSSNTSFSIVVNNQAGTNGYGRPDSVDSLTSTSCTVTSTAEYPVRWIAIGY